MTPLADDANRYYDKKNVTHVKKRFVIVRIKKRDLSYTKK